MKWYLAGPMSGIPDQNYPAFREACHILRSSLALDLVSPHESFHHPTQPDEAGWQKLLRHDAATLLACDGIILLPGWSKSKGARFEMNLALMLGMEIVFYKYGIIHDYS